jgi:intracellular sulfur oxidation DsrE/DsrF family protein
MVHIGEISFCGKKAFNIRSDDTKKHIMDHIDKKYNLKIITKHYDKFEPRMMSTLNSNPHMLCLRSNGNPYFLYLTKLNFVNYCIFIDKKIQQGYFFPRMIITGYNFDDALFQDTILDGEMVKMENDKWVYLVNDMFVYKGTYLKDQNFVKRINLVYGMLKNEFRSDWMDVSRIQVKKYFKYDQVQEMLEEHLPSRPYTCRGIYFKPLFLRFKDVLTNFDENLIKKVERTKYKNVKNFLLMDDKNEIEAVTSHPSMQTMQTMSNESLTPKVSGVTITNHDTSLKEIPMPNNTPKKIEFKLQDNATKRFSARKTTNPDIYELFDEAGNYVDVACIPSMKVSKYMRELFSKKNVVDKIDLNFEFSPKFNKWMPTIAPPAQSVS